MERDEFLSSAVQDTLRKEINELRERDERRMPTWAGFVWGILFGFAAAACWID